MLPKPLRPLALITALTLLLAAIAAFDLTPWVRGGFGWRWPYSPAAARALPLVAAVAVYVAGALWLLRTDRRPRLVLVWAMLAAALLPVLVMHLRFDDVLFELYARTAATLTTGFHRAGADIGWGGDAWRDWATFVQQPHWEGGHVAVAPPGLPLVYSALAALLDGVPPLADALRAPLIARQCHNYLLLNDTAGEWAAAWLGILMPVWSAFGVLMVYGVARRLPTTRDAAALAAVWFPLIPALVLFAGTWSTVYPILSLGAFWLLHHGLSQRRPQAVVLAGLVMGSALFLNYTFVPLVGLMGFYTLLYAALVERQQTPPPPLWRPVIVGAVFGLGLLIPWALYFLYSGETPLDLLGASMNTHLEIDRPYLPWVFIHYWDWTFFNGFALMLAWYAGLLMWLRRRDRSGTPPVLALALLCTVVVLAVSGTARGESGRVWLPFTPFVLLGAAEAVRRAAESAATPADSRRVRERWTQVLTLLHALLLLVLAVALDPINTDLTLPRPPETSPDATRPLTAAFQASDGSGFALVGWDAAYSGGGDLQLDLLWEGERPSVVPYWLGAFWVGPDGRTGEPVLWQPRQSFGMDARFPTTCWVDSVRVSDRVLLPLPADAVPGDYWLSLAVFGDAAQPEGRLRVTLADGAADVQVGLGPVRVP